MGREQDREKTILWAGTATTFAVVTLYAMGKLLSFMFRDVDPEQNEKEPPKEAVEKASDDPAAETAAEETAATEGEDTEPEDSES